MDEPSVQSIATAISDVTRRAAGRSDLAVAHAKAVHDAGKPDGQAARERAHLTELLKRDLGRRYHACSLDNFDVYHERQKAIVSRLRFISDHVVLYVGEGRGLILFGAIGTGKDHLLAATLLKATSEGVYCRWLMGMDLYGQLRDRMDKKQNEDEFLRSLCEPAVLAISEPIPPIGELERWRTEFMLRLIDRRYRAVKSTWITLNARSADDAEASLSSHVWDRLQHNAEVFQCVWPSFREKR